MRALDAFLGDYLQVCEVQAFGTNTQLPADVARAAVAMGWLGTAAGGCTSPCLALMLRVPPFLTRSGGVPGGRRRRPLALTRQPWLRCPPPSGSGWRTRSRQSLSGEQCVEGFQVQAGLV